jgi:hypothetical protein
MRNVLRVDAVRHQEITVEDLAFFPRILHHHLGIVLMADDAELGGVLKDDRIASLLRGRRLATSTGDKQRSQ